MMTVSVPARLPALGVLRMAVGGLGPFYAGREPAPSATDMWGWALAVYEAATNVVLHGHDGGSDAPITLTVAPERDHVVFTLHDTGRPNPAWPYQPRPIPELAEDGRGMAIIHRVMAEVTYGRDGLGRNVLTMRACF
ncbi:MAG: ATP-binding protein [Candidatus Sericytochromatia bacterium]